MLDCHICIKEHLNGDMYYLRTLYCNKKRNSLVTCDVISVLINLHKTQPSHNVKLLI